MLAGISELNRRVITDAGTPGPRARRTAASLACDPGHDLGSLERVRGETGALEIGQWHSHLRAGRGADRPSRSDLQEMAIGHVHLGIWRPIELIVCPDSEHGWRKPTLHGWILREHEHLAAAWVVERATVKT